MAAIYTCGRCGRVVSKSTTVCPGCGARLSGIKCQNCGFIGSKTDFAGDRCPKCRSVVRVPRQQSSSSKKQQTCKKCGKSMASGEVTCPRCGYTRWGTLFTMFLVSVACGTVFLWGPIAFGSDPGAICIGAGGLVGAVGLWITISLVIKALKAKRR